MPCVEGWSWGWESDASIGFKTYAIGSTDVISVPLTIRVRCTMAFAVCAGMLWGTPRIKISLEIPKSLISFLTFSHSSHHSHPTCQWHPMPMATNSCNCKKSILGKSSPQPFLPLWVTYQAISALVIPVTITSTLINK